MELSYVNEARGVKLGFIQLLSSRRLHPHARTQAAKSADEEDMYRILIVPYHPRTQVHQSDSSTSRVYESGLFICA